MESMNFGLRILDFGLEQSYLASIHILKSTFRNHKSEIELLQYSMSLSFTATN